MSARFSASLLACFLLAAGASPSVAQEKSSTTIPKDAPADSYNQELKLPYWAPGRGEVNHAAVRRRVLDVLEKQFDGFRIASKALASSAASYCDKTISHEDYLKAFETAWLAWAPLDSYQFGPMEQTSGALRANFWPDKKNFVGRSLKRILAKPADQQRDPTVIAAGSAAGQGFPAIERLMFSDLPECPAIVGISGHLHQLSNELYDGWFAKDGWADLARAAGPDNPIYASDKEFTKRIYTALDFGVIRIADARLGRPLGTFKRSFPKRAEAWRSGLTMKIIHAQLDGIAQMIEFGFAGDVREPDRAWMLKVIEQAHKKARSIGQPIFEAVKEPSSRIRVEALKTKMLYIQEQLAQDIGPNLGVETGFSAADGD